MFSQSCVPRPRAPCASRKSDGMSTWTIGIRTAVSASVAVGVSVVPVATPVMPSEVVVGAVVVASVAEIPIERMGVTAEGALVV